MIASGRYNQLVNLLDLSLTEIEDLSLISLEEDGDQPFINKILPMVFGERLTSDTLKEVKRKLKFSKELKHVKGRGQTHDIHRDLTALSKRNSNRMAVNHLNYR